jgi:hypothetical protein
MNQLSNVPPPQFPPPFQPGAPSLGNEPGSWRLILTGVIYLAAIGAIIWYMLRKLPRKIDGGEGQPPSPPAPSDQGEGRPA